MGSEFLQNWQITGFRVVVGLYVRQDKKGEKKGIQTMT